MSNEQQCDLYSRLLKFSEIFYVPHVVTQDNRDTRHDSDIATIHETFLGSIYCEPLYTRTRP